MTHDGDAPALINLAAMVAGRPGPGILWRLQESGRQLDANLVHLSAGSPVATHAEPDLDVLLIVVAGTGTLTTEQGSRTLASGVLVWLPRGSRRGLHADPGGLSYLTVHQRRPGLSIRPRPAQ